MQITREHYRYGAETIDIDDDRVRTVTLRTIHIFSQTESLARLIWDYDLFSYYQDCLGEDSCEWIDSLAGCARALDVHDTEVAA